MPQQFDNRNTIILFKNDREQNDNKPSFKGKLFVDEVQYEVALWTKTSQKNGNKFLAGTIKPANGGGSGDRPQSRPTAAPTTQPAAQSQPQQFQDDDIPF